MAPYASETARNLVAAFKLRRIHRDDRQWRRVIERAGGVPSVKEVWGVTGFMYLVAEYAYG